MGTNMYPSATLLGQDKDASIAALPVEELIEKADGFAGVFPGSYSCTSSLLSYSYWFLPLLMFIENLQLLIVSLLYSTEHKYEIVKKLQERKHICGMTGDGVKS